MPHGQPKKKKEIKKKNRDLPGSSLGRIQGAPSGWMAPVREKTRETSLDRAWPNLDAKGVGSLPMCPDGKLTACVTNCLALPLLRDASYHIPKQVCLVSLMMIPYLFSPPYFILNNLFASLLIVFFPQSQSCVKIEIICFVTTICTALGNTMSCRIAYQSIMVNQCVMNGWAEDPMNGWKQSLYLEDIHYCSKDRIVHVLL